MIEFINATKSFGSNTVLKNISLTIRPHEVVGVIGPSGSGKSTFLRTINGLELLTSGKVKINAKRTAMVFQGFELFPHLTVLENLCLAPMKAQGRTKAHSEELARKWLKAVRMEGFEERYPLQLSGGQQQRVAIARSLCINPDVLLFDEPTASLDPELVSEVLSVIEELRRSVDCIIIVSHELQFMSRATDRILFFDNGELIEDSQTTDFFNSPNTHRAKEFINIK